MKKMSAKTYDDFFFLSDTASHTERRVKNVFFFYALPY